MNQESLYTQINDDFGLTEWDVQLENGVLTRLDETEHTSYSFFPSSQIKQQVQMKFYQKPQPDYKLECDLDPIKSLDFVAQEYNPGSFGQ